MQVGLSFVVGRVDALPTAPNKQTLMCLFLVCLRDSLMHLLTRVQGFSGLVCAHGRMRAVCVWAGGTEFIFEEGEIKEVTETAGEGCTRRGWAERRAWGDNLISRPLMLDIDLRFITFASSSSSDSCLPFAFLFSLSRLETPSLRPRLPAPAAVLAITR